MIKDKWDLYKISLYSCRIVLFHSSEVRKLTISTIMEQGIISSFTSHFFCFRSYINNTIKPLQQHLLFLPSLNTPRCASLNMHIIHK